MKNADFSKLTSQQQFTLLIAMYVRDSLEDFHAKHLDNTQMKELNQTNSINASSLCKNHRGYQ